MYSQLFSEVPMKAQGQDQTACCLNKNDSSIAKFVETSELDLLNAIDQVFAGQCSERERERGLKRKADEFDEFAPSFLEESQLNKRVSIESWNYESNKRATEPNTSAHLSHQVAAVPSSGCVLDFDPFELLDLFEEDQQQCQRPACVHSHANVRLDFPPILNDLHGRQDNMFTALLEDCTPRVSSTAGWSESTDQDSATCRDEEQQLSESERLVYEQYLENVKAMPFSTATGECCLFCPHKIFSRRHDLSIHVRTHHLLERKFECRIGNCEARFKRKGHLMGHIAMVHEKIDKSYVCVHCCKGFSSDSAKRKHIRTVHKCEIYN